MILHNKRGLTLIESLVSIALIGVLLTGVMGAFFISKTSTVHARHRMIAMDLAREFLEREISLGYYFGSYSQSTTNRWIDGITGVAYTSSPYPSTAIQFTVTPYPATPVIAQEGGVSYKTVGFRVTWNEQRYGSRGVFSCSETAVTHVAQH